MSKSPAKQGNKKKKASPAPVAVEPLTKAKLLKKIRAYKKEAGSSSSSSLEKLAVAKKLGGGLGFLQEFDWTPLLHVFCFLVVFYCIRGALVPRPEHVVIEETDREDDWFANRRLLYSIFARADLIMAGFFLFAVATFFWPREMFSRLRRKYGSPSSSHAKQRKLTSSPSLLGACFRFFFKDDVDQEQPPFLRPFRAVDAVAIGLCVAGYLLRQAAFDELGKLFTYAVTIKQDHQLIGTGPFSLLLHPSYTGALLCIYSGLFYIGLRSRNWLIAALFLMVAAIAPRIYNEEQVLAANFGTQWQEFSQSRWRLIPFVF